MNAHQRTFVKPRGNLDLSHRWSCQGQIGILDDVIPSLDLLTVKRDDGDTVSLVKYERFLERGSAMLPNEQSQQEWR